MTFRCVHLFSGSASVEERLAALLAWQRKNPDVEFSPWSDETAQEFLTDNFGRHGRDCFVAGEPSQKSNLLGSALLLVGGGVFIDVVETEPRPIADLLSRRAPDGLFVFPDAQPNRSGAAGAMIASEAGSSWAGKAVASAFESISRTAAPMIRSGADSDVRPRFDAAKWVPVLFTGHPRCGSKAVAVGLRRAGLDIGHERFGADGVVSWWRAGGRNSKAKWPMFGLVSREHGGRELWIAGKVIHYLRDPIAAIPSIILENEANGRANNSFVFRKRKLQANFGIDISELDALSAAAVSYALWNQLAETMAVDGQILVERPDFGATYPGIAIESLPRVNTSVSRFGAAKPDIDVSGVVKTVPSEARSALERYFALYESLPV